jgi:ABC-type glycerol-3-phosphate transport system substrate-binding protein
MGRRAGGRLGVTRATALRAGAGTGVALLAGSGCGVQGGGEAGQAGRTAGAAPVTLQFVTQTLEAFPDVLEVLKQTLPHVTVEVTQAAGFAFVEKAKTMGVAGTPPDFTYANVRFIPALTDAGLLHDANVYFRRDRLDLAGVPKGVVEDYTWKGQLTTLPLDIGLGYVRYNKILFERAGQPDPVTLWQQKRWTWDAFVAAATALHRSPGGEPERAGYAIRTWEGDYLTVLRTFGGDLLTKDRSKLALEENASVAALEQWAGLATRQRASNAPDVLPQGASTPATWPWWPATPARSSPCARRSGTPAPSGGGTWCPTRRRGAGGRCPRCLATGSTCGRAPGARPPPPRC